MQARTARELGLVVRARRKQLGWSQEKLAHAAHVSRWWITEFEAGKARAELDLVLRTVEALGLALDLSPAGQAAPDGDDEPLPKIDLDELLAQHRGGGAET